MHISTSCSYRPVNDSTVDQQQYGSSVCYISQTYCYISVSSGAALSPVCLPLCLHPKSKFFSSSDIACFYFCARCCEDMVLMLLCSEAIPQSKHTERRGEFEPVGLFALRRSCLPQNCDTATRLTRALGY